MNLDQPTAEHYQRLGAMVSQMQSRFIRGVPTADVFAPLLVDLLSFTGCEYGLISEVLADPVDGHEFLRMHVLTDISWNEETRAMYLKHHSGEKTVEFHNLQSLLGAAVLSRAPVIANDPSNDERRGGLPHMHPPLNSYLGVPLFHGGEMVGLVGLANKEGGFHAGLIELFQPLFASVAAIIGAVRIDVARMKAEALLRQSEAQMRSTFEMAAVGMAHLDAGGRFLRANSELLKSFDIAEAELLQSTLFDLTHPDDRVALHTRFDQLVRGHCDRLTLEMRGIRSAQAELWLSVSAAPVAGPDGAVDFIVAVIENITARRQGAAAIVAAEAAHRANAAKSRFLSHMSHELRTPLNSVVGFSQLLQMDTGTPLSNAQRSHARQIEAAGSHLLSMINDLLDLSRIESGTVSMSIEPLDLREPIDEAVSLVSKAAADAGLRVLLQWPALGGLTRVAADRVRLRQVLVNLLSNAIKYNRRGGSITVEVAVGPEAGRVAIHIRDTGQGMSAEQLGHLFEPFNRLGAERTQIEGTGIGLLITRNLVELMGGELRVQSELGMGSCFSVLLPLPIEQARLHAGQAADSSASSLTEAPDVRLTMLYAEDNPTNVMLMQALMEIRPQWRLVVAESGHAALAIAAHEHFDLLLLDMNLGDMTGLDLLWQLRSNPQLVAVPCMMLTADALPATQKLAAQAGVMNYLTKPIDVPIFLAAIDAVAQRR